MSLRESLANWIRGRDAIVVRLPIGFGEITSVKFRQAPHEVEIKDVRLPSLTLYPGESADLNVGDHYTLTLEPVEIAKHVFGIHITKCVRNNRIEDMELSEDA